MPLPARPAHTTALFVLHPFALNAKLTDIFSIQLIKHAVHAIQIMDSLLMEQTVNHAVPIAKFVFLKRTAQFATNDTMCWMAIAMNASLIV